MIGLYTKPFLSTNWRGLVGVQHGSHRAVQPAARANLHALTVEGDADDVTNPVVPGLVSRTAGAGEGYQGGPDERQARIAGAAARGGA